MNLLDISVTHSFSRRVFRIGSRHPTVTSTLMTPKGAIWSNRSRSSAVTWISTLVANRKAKQWNGLKSWFLHFFAHIRCFIHHSSHIIWHQILASVLISQKNAETTTWAGGNSPDNSCMLQSQDISFRGPPFHFPYFLAHVYVYVYHQWLVT